VNREVFTLGRTRYDIDKFERMVQQKPDKWRSRLRVDDSYVAFAQKLIRIDWERIRTMKPEEAVKPLFAIQLSDRKSMLIVDGYHRMLRGWQDGRQVFDCYVLPFRHVHRIVLQENHREHYRDRRGFPHRV